MRRIFGPTGGSRPLGPAHAAGGLPVRVRLDVQRSNHASRLVPRSSIGETKTLASQSPRQWHPSARRRVAPNSITHAGLFALPLECATDFRAASMKRFTSGLCERSFRQMRAIVRVGLPSASDRYLRRFDLSASTAMRGINDTPCPSATSSCTVSSCALWQLTTGWHDCLIAETHHLLAQAVRFTQAARISRAKYPPSRSAASRPADDRAPS